MRYLCCTYGKHVSFLPIVLHYSSNTFTCKTRAHRRRKGKVARAFLNGHNALRRHFKSRRWKIFGWRSVSSSKVDRSGRNQGHGCDVCPHRKGYLASTNLTPISLRCLDLHLTPIIRALHGLFALLALLGPTPRHTYDDSLPTFLRCRSLFL